MDNNIDKPIEEKDISLNMREVINNDITDIEKTDETPDSSVQDPYPWNPENIRVDSKTFPIAQIVDMIKNNDLDLKPDFQRNKVWTHNQKSSLIESILLRIPIPVFYFSSDTTGYLQVVDGLQRLSTIDDFINNRFELVNLTYLTDFEGKVYKDLDRTWIRRVNTTQLIVYVIDPQTPNKVKFDVFRRINTGGMPLTEQEIRHCLSTSKNRAMLSEMVANEFFNKTTNKKFEEELRMLGKELALRFCAFLIVEKSIFGETFGIRKFTDYLNLPKYLDDANDIINEKLEDKNIAELIKLWNISCENNYNVFEDRAYTKMNIRLFNKAAFECLSVEMAFCDKDKVIQNCDKIKNDYIDLLKNEKFHTSLSYFTHGKTSFTTRFESINKMLEPYR